MDYSKFLEAQLNKAAQTAMQYFGKVTATVKADDNRQVLTEADVAVGKQLVAAVLAAFPDHNVIDEEAGVIDKGSRYTWVIDPIEATSNFAAGTPDWGIMVGLLEDATPIAGGIIAPAHNKLYVAGKGKGAACNRRPIHVTDETQLKNCLISFSTDGHPEDPDRTKHEHALLANIVLAARNTRNTNCEATDAMYVAEGRYGGRVNMVSKIWDNVAPQIICEEAGALWTAVDGAPIDYSNPLTLVDQNFTFCVASPAVHRRLQAIMRDGYGATAGAQ